MESRANNGVKVYTPGEDAPENREMAAADLTRYLAILGKLETVAEAIGSAFRELREVIRKGDKVNRRDLGTLNTLLNRLCLDSVDAGIQGTTLLVISAHQFGQ